MKHPLTEWLGGNSTLVIHRPVMLRLKQLKAPRPMEMAALLEHLTFLHRYQNAEWITCPYDDLEEALLIEERTARNYLTFLKAQGLVLSRRRLMEYKGQVSPFLQYQVQLPALAELLGVGGAENFSGSVLAGFSGSSSIKKKEKQPEKSVGRNVHFDAIVTALYPQGKISNASHVARVANALRDADWTPEDIHHVLSAVQRDTFWKKALTLGSFEKHAEDWRRRYGRARKEEARPPVVTGETTPADDLDWTALE